MFEEIPENKAILRGLVFDAQLNKGLARVKVNCGGLSVETKSNGEYVLKYIKLGKVAERSFIVSLRKEYYNDYHERIKLKPGVNIYNFDLSAFRQGVLISEDIAEDTEFQKALSPYIISRNITVAKGARLEIQPGVVVQFKENTELRIEGEIRASGNRDEKILFTSVSPTETYQGIFLHGHHAYINRCIIEYATIGIRVHQEKGDINILNSIIRKNHQDGLFFYSSKPEVSVSLSGNKIEENGRAGIYIQNCLIENFSIGFSAILNNQHYGIFVVETNISIYRNEINNNKIGIFSQQSDRIKRVKIWYNNFRGNTDWAVAGNLPKDGKVEYCYIEGKRCQPGIKEENIAREPITLTYPGD
jgi:hypothetical protein